MNSNIVDLEFEWSNSEFEWEGFISISFSKDPSMCVCGNDHMRTVLKLNFMRTLRWAPSWMVRAIRLDLRTLIRLSMNNQVIGSLVTHASNDILIIRLI